MKNDARDLIIQNKMKKIKKKLEKYTILCIQNIA